MILTNNVYQKRTIIIYDSDTYDEFEKDDNSTENMLITLILVLRSHPEARAYFFAGAGAELFNKLIHLDFFQIDTFETIE